MKEFSGFFIVLMLALASESFANPGELWEFANKGEWSEVNSWLQQDPNADIFFRPSLAENARPDQKMAKNVFEMVLEAQDFPAAHYPELLNFVIGPFDRFNPEGVNDLSEIDAGVAVPLPTGFIFGTDAPGTFIQAPKSMSPDRLAPALPPPSLASWEEPANSNLVDEHLDMRPDSSEYQESAADDEEEFEERVPRGVSKRERRAGEQVKVPYKRKKSVRDPATAVRLNGMFTRYNAVYELVSADATNRFLGNTELVFAILLELGAEENAVSLEQIYTHAETLRHRFPETLRRSSDYEATLRTTLYACQLFISPERKHWMLRGRPSQILEPGLVGNSVCVLERDEGAEEAVVKKEAMKRERASSSHRVLGYKKKKDLVPVDVEPDANANPHRTISGARLAAMFERHLEKYGQVMSGVGVFDRQTALVFAIMLELGAEAREVSLEEIYRHVLKFRDRLAPKLSTFRRDEGKDALVPSEKLMKKIRGALGACQLFVRGESRGSWRLRGRHLG